jgi:anti-sigma regulatory factor (Ser/Thr protein kinase)
MATRTRVTAEQLARELARRHEITVEQALEQLQSVYDILRAHLQAGETVEMGDLLTLSYSGGPEIREDESGGFSAYAPTRKELEVVPLGSLEQDLLEACNSAIYYVANKDGEFAELLSDYFGRRGWQVIHKRSGAEAQARLDQKPPVALIFESRSEGWQDLLREIKCNPRTNRVPVLGIFPDDTTGAPVTDITIQPDEVIFEPFGFAGFCKTAGAELAARVAAATNDVTELEIHLPGSERHRRELRLMVEEMLYRCGLPERFNQDAGSALSEALDNAWRHGHQLVDCCTIVVRVILDPRRLVLAVRDSGGGFDHPAALSAARGPKNRGNDALAKAAAALRTRRGDMREGGIARMLELADRVDYNRAGNELVLTKQRP